LQRRAHVRDPAGRFALAAGLGAARVLDRQLIGGHHPHCTRPSLVVRAITGALRPASLLRRAMKSLCSSPYSSPFALRKRYFKPLIASRGSSSTTPVSWVVRSLRISSPGS